MNAYYIGISVFFTLAVKAFASPGVVDEYDCHINAGVYHCHGDEKLAKKVHALLGISSKSTSWFYSDGPANFFIGPSIETELAFSRVALRASWARQPLVFGTNGYLLSGWDVGVKLGKGLSRIGKHGFVELGYYHSDFSLTDSTTTVFNSYQLGIGVILNKEHWSFDGKLLYRDPTPVENYWNDDANIPTSLNQLVFSLGAYRRF
jgi:hypothetical protein